MCEFNDIARFFYQISRIRFCFDKILIQKLITGLCNLKLFFIQNLLCYDFFQLFIYENDGQFVHILFKFFNLSNLINLLLNSIIYIQNT